MMPPAPPPLTLDAWFARDAIPFAVDSPASLDAAVDKLIAALGDAVDLLGFGEALHAGRDILALRNLMFQRLVEAHGYTAIAVESSFPRGHLVNEYSAGRGPASYDELQDVGFSHGFGKSPANRELVEWMRGYNADPRTGVKLRFYGFDAPTEMTVADSPRRLLEFALDYFAAIDAPAAQWHRERISPLLGDDAEWENPAAAFDPSKSIGLSPAAAELRLATEDLITTLAVRRTALVAASDSDRYGEAAQHAALARHMLNYHAGLARPAADRVAQLLGQRDVMMAENLAFMTARERGRGRVFAFAHNYHLQYGQAKWQLGPELLAWWPAGAHLRELLGPRYAVIGTGVGASEPLGIGSPEPGTLEARLTESPHPARFIPTHRGAGFDAAEIAALPTRTGPQNLSYFPLTSQSLADFDWLAVLNSIS